MWLTIFCLAIIAICLAINLSEGLWSNTVTLVNVIFAAVIATNCFEPAADFFTEQAPSFTYFAEFLSLWGIFILSLIIIRILTDKISRVKVRFKKPVEQGGIIVSGLLIGWVMVCFTVFALHLAPLKRNHFGGAFAKSPTSSNFFMSPDRLWLGFMQSRSEGALSANPVNAFDPQSEFILKYGQRRQNFSKFSTLRASAPRVRYGPPQ